MGIGFGVGLTLTSDIEDNTKPAYMIVRADRHPNANYEPYYKVAGPLARAAGLQKLMNTQEPLVLEGNWP